MATVKMVVRSRSQWRTVGMILVASCILALYHEEIALESFAAVERGFFGHSLPSLSSGSAIASNQTTLITTANIISSEHHKGRPHEALCVIEPHQYFRHFPHAAEQLFPCWSFFQENPQHQCAFQLPNTSSLSPGWIHDVVQAMNCTIYHDGENQNNDNSAYITTTGKDHVSFYVPKNPDGWFHKTSHGNQLGKRIMDLYSQKNASHHDDDNSMNLTYKSPPLSIGFVQRAVNDRHGNRAILNLDEIENATRQAFLSQNKEAVVIHEADMATLSTADQVQFWYQHDVILSAHGAACTNVAFMKPHSVIIEIYPHDYDTGMFRTLADSVGVQRLKYTVSIEETTVYPPSKNKKRKREILRYVDFRLHVSNMVELIQKGVAMVQNRSHQS